MKVLRSDKFFLQRLSNDLKIALTSYVDQNKVRVICSNIAITFTTRFCESHRHLQIVLCSEPRTSSSNNFGSFKGHDIIFMKSVGFGLVFRKIFIYLVSFFVIKLCFSKITEICQFLFYFFLSSFEEQQQMKTEIN